MANYTKINLDLQSDLVLSTANIGAVTGGLRTELNGIILSGSTEQARAIAAELVLTNNLASEVTNRVADVNAEETRALAAEGTLTSAIATEKTRAEGKESILSGEILAEKTRAMGIEGGLRTDVNSANSKVDAILASSAMSADTFVEIVALINSVDVTNDQAFAGYVTSNNAALASETANRITDVNAEETRALAAELILRNDLASEVTNRASEDVATLTSAKSYTDGREVIIKSYADQAELDAIAAAEAKDVVRAATAVSNIATAKSEAIASAESKDAARYVTVTGDIATAKSAAIAEAEAKDVARAATAVTNIATAKSEAIASAEAKDVVRAATAVTNIATAKSEAIAEAEAKDVARATTTATNLSNAISTEVSARDAAILVEKNRAMGIEGGLRTDVNSANSKVDAILASSAMSADTFVEIVALINSVDVTNDQAFAGYVTSNNAALASEVSNRITDVNAEETRALAAELVLRNNLATEVTNRIDGDTATLASAKSYTDGREVIIIQAANDYAAGLAVNYDGVGSADAAQTAAQSYADGIVADEKVDRVLADDALGVRIDNLSIDANAYTDTAVSGLRGDVDTAMEAMGAIDFSTIFAQKIGGKTNDNVTYVLSLLDLTDVLPVMGTSLQVFENGLLLEAGVDYEVVSENGVNNAKAVKFKYEIKPDWKVAFFGVPFKASVSDLVA
jgi:hypothetical protein